MDALSKAPADTRKRALPQLRKLDTGPVQLYDDSIDAVTYAAHVERLRESVLEER